MKRWQRRFVAAAIAFSQIALAGSPVFAPRAALATVGAPCVPDPGKDGPAGSMSGVSDVYYDPPLGTLAAGSTTVNLGTIDTTGGGLSSPAVGVNDELLIIQMQDGTFTYSNSSSYGSGASLGSAGLYEYVFVSAISGSTATIVGAGTGGGLLNAYHEAAATSTTGQETYQIIRVPQYTTGTMTSNFHAAYWDGKTGGVAVVDMDSLLTLGSASVYATGDGFRGGALTVANSTPASVLNNDWVDSAAMNGTSPPGQGSKGEGIFGTPGNIFNYTTYTTPSAPASPAVTQSETNGYPGGDMAMGAPGNAGGGGTDADPAANDQNTGGGGGSNAGAGGKGGYPWTPNYNGNTSEYTNAGVHTATGYSTGNTADIGGRGGAAQTPSATHVFMGGGGGAGVNNNASNDSSNPYGEYGSSGGVGGGIIMMRLATTSGSATFYANGTTGLAPENDGGGGGGAGGSIVLTAPPSPSAWGGTVTANVAGAAGTSAEAQGTTASIQHGPGGGGGGGAVISSDSTIVTRLVGGLAGSTTPSYQANDHYGAVAGSTGSSIATTASQIPGVASGGECTGAGNLLFNGPVSNGTYVGNSTTGSYDGVQPANNNNDFTAKAFFPTGATIYNASSTVGSPVGNVFTTGSSTTVNVESEFAYSNNPGALQTLTFTAQAPPGWTAQICPNSGAAPSCASAGSWTVNAAANRATSTYAVAANTNIAATKYWVVYTIPTGASLTAFSRIDVPVVINDTAANRNETHHELYPGFIALTKNETIAAAGGCTAGVACPGSFVTFAVSYQNVVVGASTEPDFPGSWPYTTAGSFKITENGTASFTTGSTGSATSNSWGNTTYSCGLQDTLVGSANGTSTYGDTASGSTFTGITPVHTAGTYGSTSFVDTPGGSAFSLVPAGISSLPNVSGPTSFGTTGTLYFRVEIVPTAGC